MICDQRHGGPYDRGTADSYYGRAHNPHFFVGDSYNSTRIEMASMTSREIAEYTAGFEENERCGNKKDD